MMGDGLLSLRNYRRIEREQRGFGTVDDPCEFYYGDGFGCGIRNAIYDADQVGNGTGCGGRSGSGYYDGTGYGSGHGDGEGDCGGTGYWNSGETDW